MGLQGLVGKVAQILGPCFVENALQRGSFVAFGKLAVSVVNRDLIPVADLGRIGMRQIDGSVFPEFFIRVGIVHDRDPALRAVVVIVTEAKRVSYFVGRKLTYAGKSGLVENVGLLGTRLVGRQQAFEDEVILTVAERAERHGCLDDFARARVRHGRAGRPAARGPVNPVDHVVADIHGVRSLGQHLHDEGVAEARRRERLLPPSRAFEQSFANVFGRAWVYVITDGGYGIGDHRVGIFLFQTMTADEMPDDGFADGRAEVDVFKTAVTGARVVFAGCVFVIGEFDQRVMLAQGNGIGGGRDARDAAGEEAAASSAPAARGPDGWGTL